MKTPRLLLRLRRGLRRLPRLRPAPAEPEPVDEAWRRMLSRISRSESERRLAEAEDALNRLG